MATEKRLIYLEDAIANIVDTPSAIAERVFNGDYGYGQNPDVLVDRQHEVIELLMDAPDVDAVEVVHGRWIIEDADSGEHGCYEAYMIVECSHCGKLHEVETGQFGWVYGDPFPFNYCPNCGAKMDGDGNG